MLEIALLGLEALAQLRTSLPLLAGLQRWRVELQVPTPTRSEERLKSTQQLHGAKPLLPSEHRWSISGQFAVFCCMPDITNRFV